MAVPKRKTTPSKRGMRRSHDALKRVHYEECGNCGALTLPHTICPTCGTYRGKQVMKVANKEVEDEG
jgi:large subunit ribosomal protein L32